MNTHVKEIIRGLAAADAFDKYASVCADDTRYDAWCKVAEISDALFRVLRGASVSDEKLASDPREAAAIRAVSAVADLCEKTASEEVIATLQKIAAVAYLDEVLTQECAKLAGEDRQRTLRCRTLGREYGVHLLRSLMR